MHIARRSQLCQPHAARFSHEEDRQWAAALHPVSAVPSAALFSGPILDAPVAVDDDNTAEEHPLKGVRFAALKAPGPSGARAEHFSEMLATSRKRLANKLLRAMGKVLSLIETGGLCDEARWITRTRSFNIPKKNGAKPRNIKSGEFLRSSAARRLIQKSGPALRRTLVGMRQWGVKMPKW